MDADTFRPTGSRTMSGGTVLGVAPDNSVWYATLDEDPSGDSSGWSCGGVRHFDGVTWDRYLPGLCVNAIDIAGHGSVLVLAKESDDSLHHVYVIAPEAVAASA